MARVLRVSAGLLLFIALACGALGASDAYETTTTATVLTGKELVSRMVVGARVIRGRDWEWGNQDGGPGGKGTVQSNITKGWVRVKWDSGETDSYRMGHEGKYDLNLADVQSEDSSVSIEETVSDSVFTSDEMSTNEDTSTSDPPARRPRISGKKRGAAMTPGTRVIKRKDRRRNKKGGKTVKGKIIGKASDGKIRVEWKSGDSSYAEYEDTYDVESYDGFEDYEKTTTTTAAPTTEQQRLRLGDRVVRGRDWNWDNQDGGVGNKGTVVREVLDGWVRVEWDSGEINSYRMGNNGKYELALADSTKETETEVTVGSRVVRGRDWKWDDQDGGVGNKGTVVRGVLDGWVRVEWDTGEINSYRMGYDGKYDLALADSTKETEVTIDPDLSALVAKMLVGARVVRGRDWKWGDQDGGVGKKGTVVREVLKGWVEVKWDSGETHIYRMGFNSKYDLILADSTIETNDSSTTSTTTTIATATAAATYSTNTAPRTSTGETVPPIIKESNELFGKLVEKEISYVPLSSRIQTMQDVLEVFKKFWPAKYV